MATEAHSEEQAVWYFTRWISSSSSPFSGRCRKLVHADQCHVWMALGRSRDVCFAGRWYSKRAIVPTRMQSVAELAYGFVYKMVEDICGKEGLKYFPYIMTLFMFIVLPNFLGLLPTAFTTTSHFAVTAVMAMAVFLTVTILGFVKNGAAFLSCSGFVGTACHCARFWRDRGYFVFRAPGQPLHSSGGQHHGGPRGDQSFRGLCRTDAVSPVAILGITAIYGLEVLVSFIQAYVFTILTCVYLKDALHPHH